MKPMRALALVGPDQVVADAAAVARLAETLVDVDAGVGVGVGVVDVVGEVKAVVAPTAEAAVEVDAVAVSAADVGVAQTLVDVDAMTVGKLEKASSFHGETNFVEN